MKLWLLERRRDLPEEIDPWAEVWDKYSGFVIAAETELAARQIAAEERGDECPWDYTLNDRDPTRSPWLSSDLSTCMELCAEGHSPGVILADFMAG